MGGLVRKLSTTVGLGELRIGCKGRGRGPDSRSIIRMIPWAGTIPVIPTVWLRLQRKLRVTGFVESAHWILAVAVVASGRRDRRGGATR